MRSRGYPLWLLRDWTAFFAFLIAFWTFIFAGFRAGRKVARGQKLSDLELQTLFQLYANAESRLDHALWRQAWRACGYSAKHAAFVQMPAPANAEELETRFLAYNRALREMEQLVVAYTDELRRRLSLSREQVGDPNAVRPAHARAASAGAFPPPRKARGRWRASPRDGGGSHRPAFIAQARAPPPYSRLPTPPCLSAQRA